MVVQYNKRASNAMRKVARWVENENTEGSGERWFKNLRKEIEHLATIKVKHAICKDASLAKFKYRCFTHKDKWIVAYKIMGDKFVVYRFTYGPWLAYN
jgi:hypothetical protein